jgi:hypothetical protein
MNKKLVMLTLCIIALMVCIFAFAKQAQTNPPSPQQAPLQSDSPVPEHVAYAFLFRNNAFFRKKAIEAGKPPARNTAFQKEAGLSDVQALVLDEIAAATMHEVDQQDARARVIIERFRAQFPNGVVPKGQPLPEPPPELKIMQEERNAMILRGRDRLLTAFGEQKFARFNEFIMKRFTGKGLFVKELR